MDEQRYWALTSENEDNRLRETEEASGMHLAAIVDEEAGGIIGYVLLGEADRVIRDLNATESIRRTAR